MTADDDDERVSLSAEALQVLMRQCQSLGWEVAKGFHTEDSADVQRDRLFREFTGRQP